MNKLNWIKKLGLATVALLLASEPTMAQIEAKPLEEDRVVRQMPLQLGTAADLIAQSNLTRVTGVEVIQTAEGFELVLETVAGSERLVPLILSEENDLVIDILDATLAFSIRNGVEELNPAPGISRVTVNQVDDSSIQVRITGENQTPSAEIDTGREDLVLSIIPDRPTVQSPSEDGQEPDETIEIVVTGTRVEVPIEDTPQSIQVIPREVLEDRGVVRLDEFTDNVSGVQRITGGDGFGSSGFIIRGFPDLFENLRNGFRSQGGFPRDLANIDRVEVLKGPAAALYGGGFQSGVVNILTEKPLEEPRYEVEATVGSFDFYRGEADLTGPLVEN